MLKLLFTLYFKGSTDNPFQAYFIETALKTENSLKKLNRAITLLENEVNKLESVDIAKCDLDARLQMLKSKEKSMKSELVAYKANLTKHGVFFT